MFEVMPIALACLALMIEALFGYPDRLLRAVGHPVTWIGRLIGALDRTMNRDTMRLAERRAAGAASMFIVIVVAGAIAYGLEASLARVPGGLLLVSVLASTLIAQRSLYDHVARVADALERDGLASARAAVAHIVGRDPDRLDAAGVARAAIESLAENFSDGVVAPALWLMIGGLAGGAAYKAINTADSMIGHRTLRYAAFGYAAAKLDDLLNLPASRLAALWITIAARFHDDVNFKQAVAVVQRDARNHRSPNAGWPEAAMAGALNLKLSGPRCYHRASTEDAWIGEGKSEATTADIRRALALYRTACSVQIAALGVLALLIAQA